MISNDSVLATQNSFVVVDKITKPQWVRSFDGKVSTMLTKVLDGKSVGMLIETKHFSIIASPDQKFITSQSEYKSADQLKVGDTVLTAAGWELITLTLHITSLMQMSGVFTKSKAFVANSFVLLCDY
jgi:hypothetical protein